MNIDAELEKLQRETFGYFLHETNPANGLVIDKTAENWPASIAATGLALACYPVGVERGFMSRAAAVERTLATLRFFWNSTQGPELDATGYKGFYYHFLDMQTGRRAWQCELSTVDSAFLLAGALTTATVMARVAQSDNILVHRLPHRVPPQQRPARQHPPKPPAALTTWTTTFRSSRGNRTLFG